MVSMLQQRVRLGQWAKQYGLTRAAAYRMYKEDRMPANIKVEQVGRLLYVILPNTDRLKTIGYARVSSHDRKGQLKTQEERLWAYAGRNKIILDDVVSEVASGLNDNRKKLNALLSDPDVGYILVEHRERLARFGVNMIDAALKSRGGGVLVIDDAEIEEDLVRDMTDVLTSFCARLYDKRSARNRAEESDGGRAMTQAQFINAGIVVPLRLTHKQQRYAARCIGIDRYCYNWMVATHSLMRSCWGNKHQVGRAGRDEACVQRVEAR